MARDYAAEYAARSERAQEYGFSGYGEQRGYIERHAEEIASGREALGIESGAYNPHEAYQHGLIEDYGEGLEREEWGQLAHELMADLMEYYEDEAEALAAMHDLIGETP